MISETNKTQMDFAEQYRDMSDEAILQRVSEGGLLPEAEAALRVEMQRRSLSLTDVQSFRVDQKRGKLHISVGNNLYSRGTGLRFRGHKYLTEADQRKGAVVVTRWLEFASVPLIPLGSYRLLESDGEAPKVVGKVKLQWDQVFLAGREL